MKKDKAISLRISAELFRKFKKILDKDAKKVSGTIAKLIEEFVNNNKG